ncbi:hypothetical protein [Christiangramia salexigens]|uniref:Uncharacterized protein n=1 Tax=Christiangramia salexigens TaxID=1913577 RepID=A0A1L3J1K7_9FLAO|nr:hypothetical protein [Christiangramia salexigens]APG59006.1 hypothetical protein LPB144_00685 [Christiangramia salexigens]
MGKISTKQALLDLIHVDVHLPKIASDYPEFKPITDFIIEGDFLNEEEDKPYPTVKDVAEHTDIRYDKVRKQVLKLYDLMFPFLENRYLKFTEVKYQLHFSYFGRDHYMVIDSFPVPLRVGENVSVPFLKAKFQIYQFYVSSINHRFEQNVQYIEVELKSGDYNMYWHLRKDEGLATGEIPRGALYAKDDYSLREEIIKGKDMTVYNSRVNEYKKRRWGF